MQEHWDALLLNVAFPMMCFSDEDMELWTDDPHEYIRKVRAQLSCLCRTSWETVHFCLVGPSTCAVAFLGGNV
eukprot:1137682-Pelagomonas_calceolata.AAC.5